MQTKTTYSRTEEVENVKVEYFVTSGKAFGIGIREIAKNGATTEDLICDIFPTQDCAEEFAVTLANHTVLAVSLRDILRDYFVGKLLQ